MSAQTSPDNSPSAPPASRPMVGILWMLVTGLFFVAVTATVKMIDGRVPAAQAAFVRYLFGLVLLLPMIGTLISTPISGAGWRLFVMRGVVHTLGVTLWFFAMSRITIAELTALNYMTPVFVTLGAALFLGERLAARRIAAIGVAVLGALIILRPGFREIELGHLAMLCGALFLGASYLLAKRLSGMVPPSVVVAWLSITVTIGLAPLAIPVWVTPSMVDLGWLALVAVFATAGHYTMTLALRAAPVAVTQPVIFLQLVWAVLLGVVFFGEPIDPYVVLGGTIIVCAISFIAWREARLKKKPPPPSAVPGKI